MQIWSVRIFWEDCRYFSTITIMIDNISHAWSSQFYGEVVLHFLLNYVIEPRWSQWIRVAACLIIGHCTWFMYGIVVSLLQIWSGKIFGERVLGAAKVTMQLIGCASSFMSGAPWTVRPGSRSSHYKKSSLRSCRALLVIAWSGLSLTFIRFSFRYGIGAWNGRC